MTPTFQMECEPFSNGKTHYENKTDLTFALNEKSRQSKNVLSCEKTSENVKSKDVFTIILDIKRFGVS